MEFKSIYINHKLYPKSKIIITPTLHYSTFQSAIRILKSEIEVIAYASAA